MSDLDFVRPRLAFLEARHCERIHQAALEILRRTGVRVFHEEALRLLSEAGCLVQDQNLVRIPAALVEWALRQPPSRISLCRRGSAEVCAPLAERSVSFGLGSDCPNYLDPLTGQRRPFTLADLQAFYRLADGLPELSFLMSAGIPADWSGSSGSSGGSGSSGSSASSASAYRRQFALMIQNSAKPIVFVCDDGEDCRRIVAAAAAVAGGPEALRLNPTLVLYSEPTTPLEHSRTALEKLLVMAEAGLPLLHSPAPMMGGTAPATLAGGLALGTAEALSGLAIQQLKRRGAPFVFGSGLHHLDMRTSISVYGAPEFQLARLAVADLARFYGLPSWGYAGHTDSCLFDEQAAADAVFSTQVALDSGTNLIHDVGYLEAGLTGSPELVVFTCEAIRMLRRYQEGFRLDAESLALEVIQQTGPGGNFLAADHTLEHFREFWQPELFSRQRLAAWQEQGSKSLGARVREKTVERMKQSEGSPLPGSQAEEVDYILK